ncbi:MAG: DUF1343 domain-containing protein [Flavobacteriaceae bacterium]|nr:DUF1343 domain-containing protein [Flavobacteriaceae bacterium]
MINRSFKSTYFFLVLISLTGMISCKSQTSKSISKEDMNDSVKKEVIVGANHTEKYLPLLKDKNIGIVANQTSVLFKEKKNISSHTQPHQDLGYTHLIDSLLANGVQIKKVFAPEHGFRGKADAGEHIKDGKDAKTGLPIISLYGKNKKPSKEQLQGIDLIVFDIQDVGVRFYTYIATLQYVMEACAEAKIPIVVLDRPNPNGHYVDGPILELKHRSFLGLNPIPLVYGMTIGEYANMINKEGWLANNLTCDLTVISLENYIHQTPYSLAIRPSPNLPNDMAINLYPSLGFFEGTTINAGRGTEMQFQVYGAPFFKTSDFSYTPQANFGAKYPKHKGKRCYGTDLRNEERLSKVDLKWLVDAYKRTPKNEKFFGPTFTAHAGTTKLQEQIEADLSPEEIRNSWNSDLEMFMKIREKYLLYD